MPSYALFACVSALAGHAVAEAMPEFHLAGYAAAPTPTSGPKLGRRQDMDCFASITETVLVVDEPEATELVDWASSATFDIDDCTVTAPASLSSALVSYASYVSEFWDGVESRFDAVDTMCEADELRIDLTLTGCSETQTAVFTSGSETETVDLPRATLPTERLTKTSAAAGQRGMMSLAGVASAALTAMLVL